MINKVAVESSNIASIGFEDGILEVTFKNSSTYQAKSVEKSVYDEFLASKSKGSYFAKNLRNAYKFEKVG